MRNKLLKYFLILSIVTTTLSTSNNLLAENFWGIVPTYTALEAKVMEISSTDEIYCGSWGDGMRKSTDNGATFTLINSGLTNKYVSCIEIAPNGFIYIGTFGGGVFRSSTGGISWTQINTGLTNLKVKAITASSNGDLWVGTFGSGIFFSENGGTSWTQKSNGLYYKDITSLISFTDNVILAGTSNAGIFKSSDKGESWYHSSPGIDTATITCFYIDILNQVYVGTQGSGVYVSVNGGADWASYHRTNSPKNITCITGYNSESIMVGTSEKGLWRYDLTYENWRSPYENIDGVNDLKRNSTGQYFAITPYKGLIKTRDALGYDWGYVSLTTSNGISLLGMIDDVLYIRNGDSGFVRSSDFGKTWSSTILSGNSTQFIAKDSSGNLWLTANYMQPPTLTGYLYKSSDNGVNWTQILSKADTTFYAIAAKSNGSIFVGISWPPPTGSDPKTTNHGAIIKSTNSGVSWAQVTNRIGLPPKVITINKTGNIYANLNIGLCYSSNDGTTWNQIFGNTINFNDVIFDNNNILWAATENSIHKTTNNGTNWISYSVNATNTNVKKLICTSSNTIFALIDGVMPYLIKTTNSGIKWDSCLAGISFRTNESLVINRDGLILFSNTSLYKGIESVNLGIPNQISLKQDSVGVVINPTLTWNKVRHADLYEVQLTNTLDFSNIIEKAVISDTLYTLTKELSFNNTYLWRIRSKMNSSLSEWSESRRFYTLIDAPKLIYPKDKITGRIVEQDLLWNSVEGATQYYVSLSTDSTFSNGNILTNKLVVDTTLNVKGLKLLTTYYWKVQAVTPVTRSAWSKIWSFRTTLNSVTLISPKNGTYGLNKEVTMVWDTSKTATNYIIELALDPEFSSKVYAGNSDNFNKHTIKILQLNTTYYWRVQAYSSEGYSDWSTSWKFTTSLPEIVLINPSDGSKDLATKLNFEWGINNEATQYHFILASDKDFKNILANDSTITKNTYSYEPRKHYTDYYWKVRMKKNNLFGLWSDIWTFATNLDKPTLSYPVNKTDNMPISVSLEWNKLLGAELYELQIAQDSSFKGSVIIKDSLKSSILDIGNLKFDSKYYWKIRGKYQFGISPWSEIWEFKTIADNTSVFDVIASDPEIYPNPFNESINIKLNLKSENKVKLVLYNLDGNEIVTLFDGYKGAGMHLITYYPTQIIASGEYLIKINISDNEIIKNVVFVK